MRSALIFVVGVFVGLAMRTATAQDTRLPGTVGINHVAIVTDHFEAMKTFYTQTMGFREAFTIKDASGQPTLMYLQASRNTFVEMFPASAARPAGFNHYGLVVDDIKATVDRLKQRGVEAGTPRQSSTGSTILTITDPDGTRIELTELGPTALARKAMDAWQ